LTVASRNSNAEIAGRLVSLALAAAGGNPFKVKAHRRAADKIARCVSVEDLRQQLRFIDKLNGRLKNIRVLKSAEVDILADGSLDYPDDLLAELDYTVCSIHSRFNFGKRDRTERILRAVDIRYFNILGHATDPRLLKRPGYEIDLDRILRHAKYNGCSFKINANPGRLDLTAENVRTVASAGLRIAVSTEAHSTAQLEFARCGIDQTRRAWLTRSNLQYTLSWKAPRPLFRRY